MRMNPSKAVVCSVGVLYAAFSLMCLLKPSAEYSVSERRRLLQRPDFSIERFLDGSYREQLESYVTDQFPLRDRLRFVKAFFEKELLRRQDSNQIYEKEGYLCKMEYPMNENSIQRAAVIFQTIYEKNLSATQASCYFSVIPDKNYFLAEDSHLSIDYDAFFDHVYRQAEFAQPLRLEKQLELEDYYRTDTHWKQEKIVDVATYMAEGMGALAARPSDVAVVKTELPFYGVYYGQAALRVKPDRLSYCESNVLQQYDVFDHENNKKIPLYDLEKASGRDPYEMFLGGNLSLVTIQNPLAETEKELVIFGDSFSRSIAPLLAQYYKKTTLYDIRYLSSAYIDKYITFTDQDVLFLYSTSVLNNSITLK